MLRNEGMSSETANFSFLEPSLLMKALVLHRVIQNKKSVRCLAMPEITWSSI